VHPIRHQGKYFTVPGIHMCEPSPQRTPLLFHSGASPASRRFAAEHAEVIFAAATTPGLLRPQVDEIRKLAAEAGRDPASIRFLALMTVITASSDEEAHAKYQDYLRYASYDGALALYGLTSGIDMSVFGLDEPVRPLASDGAQTEQVRAAIEAFRGADPDLEWTPREVARWVTVGGIGPVVVGSPGTVAAEMERWTAEAGVDGFNLAYAIAPGTFEDVVDFVVPELQRRGLMRTRYEGSTLRENWYGAGQQLLRDDHPGAWYRRPATSWTAPVRVFQ
jgi:long-chain alkane monooxygenase